ncbi:UNVERIFIED_CONTAM: hypothetical protein FKN15_065470 [Acipenser sinensis]
MAELLSQSMEQQALLFKTEISALRADLTIQISTVQKLISKLDLVADRGGRNIRIVNLEEGVEKDDPIGFVKRSIPVWFLGLAQREFEVERAHRIYGGNKAGGRDRPRIFIFKLLRYTDRQVILQENRKAGPVCSTSGSILSFFPDFSPMTANMRNAFSVVRKSLRAAGVPNFLLYPAVLKVFHNGSQHLLQSPQEAEAFMHDKITSPHQIDQ